MVGSRVVSSQTVAEDQGFEVLLAESATPLRRFLVQMVRDPALADDLLQDTFLAAYQARDRMHAGPYPQAWLYGIARHRALRALRRERRFRSALSRLGNSPSPPEPATTAIEVMDVLDRVLDPDDRSLVLLRYVHDLDATTLAALTGRTPAAIRKRLERACKKLLEEMAP